MKYALKTKCLAFVLLIVLLCSSLLLLGCSKETNKKISYVGTYESTFVDSQNKEENISFSLDIKSDNTFILTRYVGDEEKEYSGYYKSYTESDKEQLLFIVEEGFEWSEENPNAWNPYFTVCRLDDGTLMAKAGTTFTSSATITAFGKGSVSRITLILFDKT